AVVPILATVYQTLVLTDLTDDVIRLGIDGEHYSMIWTNVAWGVATLFGVFLGIWGMARYGSRDTLVVGLVWFAAGKLLCGGAGVGGEGVTFPQWSLQRSLRVSARVSLSCFAARRFIVSSTQW